MKLDLFATRSWLHSTDLDTSSNRYAWDGSIVHSGRAGGEIYDYKSATQIHSTYTLAHSYAQWQIADGHALDFNYNFIRQDRIGSSPNGATNSFTKIDPLTIPAAYIRNIFGASYRLELPELGLTNMLAAKYFIYSAEGSGDFVPLDHFSDGVAGFAEAIKYTPFESLLLRASYEATNRLPENQEVFGDGLFILTNFALKPEQSDNFNVGGRYSDHIGEQFDYSVESNLFYRNVRNLIVPVSVGLVYQRYVNQNEGHIRGAEMDLAMTAWKALSLGANVTLQDLRRVNIKDKSETYLEDSRLPNIPYFFYNISASFRQADLFIPKSTFEIYWYYSYVHEFYLGGIPKKNEPKSLWDKTDISTELVIPTQSIHSAGLTYTLPGDRLSLAFEASNIFDAKSYDNFMVQKPGRAFHLKLRSVFR